MVEAIEQRSQASLPPIDMNYEYPAAICIRNTFLDGLPLRPPSFEEFLEERKVRSCPATRTSSGDSFQDALLRAHVARAAQADCGADSAGSDDDSEPPASDVEDGPIGPKPLPSAVVAAVGAFEEKQSHSIRSEHVSQSEALRRLGPRSYSIGSDGPLRPDAFQPRPLGDQSPLPPEPQGQYSPPSGTNLKEHTKPFLVCRTPTSSDDEYEGQGSSSQMPFIRSAAWHCAADSQHMEKYGTPTSAATNMLPPTGNGPWANTPNQFHWPISTVAAPPGSFVLPSLGSVDHARGNCKPCAFVTTRGCGLGAQCTFCHLCEPGEKRRRRKEKIEYRRYVRDWRRASDLLRGLGLATYQEDILSREHEV